MQWCIILLKSYKKYNKIAPCGTIMRKINATETFLGAK